jgi:hypothetical protein
LKTIGRFDDLEVLPAKELGDQTPQGVFVLDQQELPRSFPVHGLLLVETVSILVHPGRRPFYPQERGAPTRIQQAVTPGSIIAYSVLPTANSDNTVDLTGSISINAEDLAKMSDHYVLGHIQPEDAPKHTQSEKPKIESNAGDEAEHARNGHL